MKLILFIIFILGFSCGFSLAPDNNYITLKEYVDTRFKALEELINTKFQLAQVAVDKFEKENEAWRANANEWRGQSKDREGAYALKSELNPLKEDISNLQLSEATLAGKASQTTVNITMGLSILAIIVSVYAILIDKKRINVSK